MTAEQLLDQLIEQAAARNELLIDINNRIDMIETVTSYAIGIILILICLWLLWRLCWSVIKYM